MDQPVEKILEKMIQTPVLIEKVVEKPVEYVQERIVETPIETIVERIVERPVFKEVEKIVDKVVEKVVEIVVEKPVIVYKTVERPVEKVVERYGQTTKTVTHQAKGKASEVKAKFLGARGDIRETEWVERSTGDSPRGRDRGRRIGTVPGRRRPRGREAVHSRAPAAARIRRRPEEASAVI